MLEFTAQELSVALQSQNISGVCSHCESNTVTSSMGKDEECCDTFAATCSFLISDHSTPSFFTNVFVRPDVLKQEGCIPLLVTVHHWTRPEPMQHGIQQSTADFTKIFVEEDVR